MAQTQTPFGMLPRWHPTGQTRANQYENCLLSGQTTNIYYGTPVMLAVGAGNNTPLYANAALGAMGATVATGATVLLPVGLQSQAVLGVFGGCEYTDVNGRRQYSKFWPSGLTLYAGTYAIAYVFDDPNNVYEIQLDGAVNTASYQQVIGRQTNFTSADLSETAPAGNATPIGQSAQRASATLVSSNGITYGTSNTGQLVIVETPDISEPGPLSGQGSIMDPFPSIFVQINKHQIQNPVGNPATV